MQWQWLLQCTLLLLVVFFGSLSSLIYVMELLGETEQAPKKKPKLGRHSEVKKVIKAESWGRFKLWILRNWRPNKDDPDSHKYAYSSKIRYLNEESVIETPVCYKVFISIYGITPWRVQTLQSMLSAKGIIVKDRRDLIITGLMNLKRKQRESHTTVNMPQERFICLTASNLVLWKVAQKSSLIWFV